MKHLNYRSEIDGLRAIAVLIVVFFHSDMGCTGGYVGVDVFFVISGFLITSLIWSDLERGRFTFANFWERRARRIVPALVVVTVATLVAGWFLLLPADYKSLGRAAASQAVFAANIHYWRDSGYFASAAETKPLLHTWSLAVEEQFYLFVPFLFWAMFRSRLLGGRTRVVAVLSALCLGSFGLSLYGVAHSPSITFYLLPTRAWELLLGAILAVAPATPGFLDRRVARELVSLLGLVLILVPAFAYTRETPFPGLAALPPCLGAALVLWANGRGDGAVPTTSGAALSLRPLTSIGLISYSLYLWHWPFLAFSKYLAPASISFGYRAGLLGLGFLCAFLSWKYVESPFRERKLGASRRAMYAFAGAGLATVLGGGALCMGMQGFPSRFGAQTLEYADAAGDMAFTTELGVEDVRAGHLLPIGRSDPALPVSVLVWGDSHAMAATPAVDAFLKERGLAGRMVGHSSTAPVLDWFMVAKYGLSAGSVPFNEAVYAYTRSQRVPDVILSAYWSAYAESDPKPFDAALLGTVRRLVGIGARVWVLLDVPKQSLDPPTALALSTVFRRDLTPNCTRTNAVDRFDLLGAETINEIVEAGGRIIDPKPRFTDPTGTYFLIESDGVALYRDGQHLSTRGATRMLLPLIRDALVPERQ